MLVRKIALSLFLLWPFSFSFAHSEKNQTGAVASAHPLATQAGLDILKKGGNAFDAAIAIAATLNVVEPAMSGIGGYGNTLIYDADKEEIRYLNSSGKFPLKANANLMRPPTPDYLKNRRGPKSISTPSNLHAWEAMHQAYGRTPWNQLFDHAILHAQQGFSISPLLAKIIATSFNQFPEETKQFYGKEGRPLQVGEMLIQKNLAKTFELIAKKGTAPFYHGEIAQLIDKQMKEEGAFLSLQDLEQDTAQWWPPLKINHHGYEVYTMGTPGNGYTTLYALGVMEQFPLQELRHNSVEYLHILAEVLKTSSKLRLKLAGTPEEKNTIKNDILSENNFITAASSIDLTRASSFEANTTETGHDTTHFVVIDQWGNIVSSTQTLGWGFGSKVMIKGTGIWMNSAMAFATYEPPGNPMDVFPGRYKLSDNAPIIIMKDNQPWAALGTPGGHTIIQNAAQLVINLINFHMPMQQAIDSAKMIFVEENQSLFAEPGIPQSKMTALNRMGHKINDQLEYIGASGRIGNAMGIKIVRDKNRLSFDVGVDKRRLENQVTFKDKDTNKQ